VVLPFRHIPEHSETGFASVSPGKKAKPFSIVYISTVYTWFFCSIQLAHQLWYFHHISWCLLLNLLHSKCIKFYFTFFLTVDNNLLFACIVALMIKSSMHWKIILSYHLTMDLSHLYLWSIPFPLFY
jgi:hypothetical protein